tara:strand:+ start:222 stop:764 length:543 start_codon:yes stop_codon:yes gene_type:complete
MKLNYLIKLIPFLSTLVILIVLNISNQKVNTKLRILIWNTPSYSLGTYLAISTGAGFITSYILTTSLSNINRLKSNRSLQYKYENNDEENDKYTDSNFIQASEKTLIEREINDPTPTINAQFRVIGKTERYSKNYTNNYNAEYDTSSQFEDPYNDQNYKNDSISQENEISDWNDDSFATW